MDLLVTEAVLSARGMRPVTGSTCLADHKTPSMNTLHCSGTRGQLHRPVRIALRPALTSGQWSSIYEAMLQE